MGTGDLLILIVGLGVAGFAKGTTGMGLPLVATPILAGVFGPKSAVVIVTIPIFAANSVLLLQGWRRLDVLRTVAPVIVAIGLLGLVPTLLALMAGIFFRGRLDQARFRQLIVVLLVLSVANLLWRTVGL